MDTFVWVIIITTIAGVGGTGIGGLIGALFGKNNDKVISLLLSFAAGVMLAIVCFDLVPSAVTPSGGESVNIFLVIGGIALGFGLVFLLNRFIDKNTNKDIKHIDDSHPKTADSPEEIIHSDHYNYHEKQNNNKQMIVAGLVMAFAIALHNVPEGMVIGTSIVSTGIVSGGTGLTLAIIIGLHNIPEGMGISVPLIAGGTKKGKAVAITAACGIPTVVGAIMGYFLGMLGPIWLSLSLSFASGAMLYVVFGELLPESILIFRSKLPAMAVLVGIFVGLCVIYF